MKKLLSKLFIFTLGVTALSGCDLFTSSGDGKKRGDEDHEVKGLVLEDYSTSVLQNANYKFDGKVYLNYVDSSVENYEVTSDCTFTTVDTSTVGNSELKVSYEGSKYVYSKKVYIKVTENVTLTGLEVKNYTSSVKKGTEYTFNGTVNAVYSNGTTKDVTHDQYLGISALDTSTEGKKPLDFDYTENGVTVRKTVEINVYTARPKLTKIVATGYTQEVEKNAAYTFDGNVTATFEDNTTEIVTQECQFNYDNSFSTSTTGTKSLKIKYTTTYTSTGGQDVEIYKTTTASISVTCALTALSGAPVTVGVNRTQSIELTYTPTDATNKAVTYTSNNTSIATVDASGVVTGKAVGTTTVTVTSKQNSSITATVNITVQEVQQDAWTILLYLCGADLESGGDYGISYGGAATSDIQEILSVNGQPQDVNFVIQTGGAKQWKSTYGISSSYNQRYHVANKQLVKDNDQVYTSYKGMGEASTLQDFLEWGLKEYPAEKVGLILWNHGGGLDGVCYDEKDSDKNLTDNEVVSAVSGALTTRGLSKLEFIGYDACLMQMMEIAEFNAPYFNYQIASQESEAGTGWDYDTWVDDLYAKKSTETILKAIVDGFINDNGGVNGTGYNYQGQYYPADQTLSYLDLSKVGEFKTAWESLATQIKSKITTSNKSTFKNNIVGASKYFAGDSYTYYAEFDCYDFLDKLSSNSTFNPGGNYISNARTALTDLVEYNVVQTEGAAKAHGLSFYFGSYYNSSTYSSFTNWVSLVNTVGGFSYSGGWY